MAPARKGNPTSPARAIPRALGDIRGLLRAVDWEGLAKEVEREAQASLVIVGPVNSGKSTLFNLLKGRKVSPVSAVPGTTRALVSEQIGPFTITDTPGFGEVEGIDRAGIALGGLRNADLAILLLDASAGLRQADLDLLRLLQQSGRPFIVALNKIDAIGGDLDAVLAHAREKLGLSEIIPISAKRGTNVAERLMPAIIDAHPNLAVAIGRELPLYRRQACGRVIRNATALAALVGTEPVPLLDIPFLLANLARMVIRIAAIYGEPLTAQHSAQLAASLLGGLALRYLAQQAAKFLPGPGWMVAGSVAAAGTWSIGRVIQEYFEGGKRLSAKELRRRYGQLLRMKGEAEGALPPDEIHIPVTDPHRSS